MSSAEASITISERFQLTFWVPSDAVPSEFFGLIAKHLEDYEREHTLKVEGMRWYDLQMGHKPEDGVKIEITLLRT